MRDPWVLRSAALLSGGLCGALTAAPFRFWLLGFFCLLGVRLLYWQPRDFFGKVYRPEILLLGVSLLLGFIYGSLAERTLLEPLALNKVEITGTLKDWNIGPDKTVGTIFIEEVGLEDGEVTLGKINEDWMSTKKSPSDKADQEKDLPGQTYRLVVYSDKLGEVPSQWKGVQPGDQLHFQARLERPKPLGTPGAFDLRLYNAVRGLSGTLTAAGDVELVRAGEPGLSWKIRRKVHTRLEAWDPQETGVLEGIFFGDSSHIPAEIQERYKVTGVLHVFAASGSNVAFVLGLVWMILRPLPKQLRITGAILVLILYAVLCGGNAPIVRATVLGVAVLIGRFGRGRVAALRWLFFAGVGLFILNPLILRDIGFQLSFCAAWGMLVLVPRLLKTTGIQRVPAPFRSALASTVAAQAATLPLLITAFHRLSLIGLLANVLILFILGSVLEIGLLGVILAFSWWLCAPFFQVSLWLLAGANKILEVLAGVPWADVWIINPGPFFGLVWFGGIGVILWGKERLFFSLKVGLRSLRRKLETLLPKPFLAKISQPFMISTEEVERAAGGGIANHYRHYRPIGVVLLLIVLLWSPWNSARDLEVDLIDVGQGDAILIRTPENHALLIDAGPRNERFDAGERIVLPYLLQTGIGHLDAVLITHEHQDHIGGIRAVLKAIPTDWVGIPKVEKRLGNEEWGAGLPLGLADHPEELKALQTGDRIELDSGAFLEVLGPQYVLSNTHSDPNNNSLVMKLSYSGHNVFLTGDMEQEEMEEIAGTGCDLETDVFKEPHHGSRFSLDRPWLDGIHPQAVLISVGKNTFGHPAPEIIGYWEERHVPVYRTDEQGTLRVILQDGGIEVAAGR
ncbi:ComEC/Rec2-related protein [Desulfosporosinus acidiphilus SJ4]|uniref:ComEC/Rec2-related protein n=1 Tax=Desulfosporosinus acidiphilus (strain DSM 22704 / JCM 16185 / SJ4) TaxID=646529 RepID=I4DAT6_DESAJ|nr:ComEC/Rec2 family competence protein [Desulfosporosinus acidiphilus]AFM42910.1 ComEC/Rec2-related protein [Desulfosporosinus acidiphilus SJ4]